MSAPEQCPQPARPDYSLLRALAAKEQAAGEFTRALSRAIDRIDNPEVGDDG